MEPIMCEPLTLSPIATVIVPCTEDPEVLQASPCTSNVLSSAIKILERDITSLDIDPLTGYNCTAYLPDRELSNTSGGLSISVDID